MDNCGICLYFGDPITSFNDNDIEYNTKYHECTKIKHMEYLTHGCRAPEYISNAGVIDGSGYYAALVVSADFGCINFKIK